MGAGEWRCRLLLAVLGAKQRVVQVATDRAREATLLSGLYGPLATVVRRAVGALE